MPHACQLLLIVTALYDKQAATSTSAVQAKLLRLLLIMIDLLLFEPPIGDIVNAATFAVLSPRAGFLLEWLKRQPAWGSRRLSLVTVCGRQRQRL